jgi:hypothetical protein
MVGGVLRIGFETGGAQRML